jgi:hypothetical protein
VFAVTEHAVYITACEKVASPNFEVTTGEFCGAGRAVAMVDIISK